MLFVDYRYHSAPMSSLRNQLSVAVYPLQWIADSPFRLIHFLQDSVVSYRGLMAENEQLKQMQFMQSARLQKYEALEAENVRLRALLQSSSHPQESLLAAEIIKISSDPLLHRVILNKGLNHGIQVGQAVIDKEGVIGEVIEVYPTTSRVIILTDASCGVPVENVRTGVRGVVVGTGSLNQLELKHVANTLDLAIGDNLVTSGLDGHYPPGYPVGTISNINQDAVESFGVIQVAPKARFDRVREVLLVQPPLKAE